MEEADEQSLTAESLERCTYRFLQHTAKALHLPSNYKKIYLIQLICAKQFSTPEEVNRIVQKVKLERQQLIRNRKKKARNQIQIQKPEISSTRNSQSPPITNTPKRRSYIPLFHPDHDNAVKYKPKVLIDPVKHRTYPSAITSCDRVLRSSNTKKPDRRILNLNNSFVGVIKAINSINTGDTRITIVKQEGRPKFNESSNYVMQRSTAQRSRDVRILPMSTITSMRCKRQRTVSGIYPLTDIQTSEVSTQYRHNIENQYIDRRLSRVNSLVQKLHTYPVNSRPPQSILKMNNHYSNTPTNLLKNSNTQKILNDSGFISGTANKNHLNTFENVEDDQIESYSVHVHKKIWDEQRSDGDKGTTEQEVMILPRINDVFSKFNERKDLTQPIYVQVGDEAERLPEYPVFSKPSQHNTNMLECLYNFKKDFILNESILTVNTTSNTKCVFSTPIMSTAMVHQPAGTMRTGLNTYSYEQDSQFNYTYNLDYDYLTAPSQDTLEMDFQCDEVLSRSSSIETCSSQNLGASVTIPEMMEDALELISQDGDYMERINMDLRMQCLLCSWAGPKMILDAHIRKEHPNEIHKQESDEWNITYTLGSLVQQQCWLSRVVECDSVLYALSAKYQEPDQLMATVSIISNIDMSQTGTVTVYNKVTGEPYSWNGDIEPVSPNLPYQNYSDCLKLDLSKLNLLPNSANLKLVNGELILKSPTKVVVGQPELNDIHIIFFVKISHI